MTQQHLITTPANTGLGNSPKAAFDICEANFNELYASAGVSGAFIGPLSATGPITAIATYPGFTIPASATPGGTSWGPQFDANWNVVQTQIKYNPTEWQVYTNAAQGIAQVINGTNQVVLVSGTPFDAAWVGLPYFYFAGNIYKVLSVTDASHLTVQTVAGGTVTWGSTTNDTFYFCTTSTTSVVNTNGNAVTFVSGQPFISFIDQCFINGVAYTVSAFNSPTSLTLSTSAGVQNGVTCSLYKNIGNELSNIRLQGLAGANEENFVITYTPAGAIIQTTYAGAGKYRKIIIGTGELPVGTLNAMIDLEPNATLGNPGTLSLGGLFGAEAMRIGTLQNQVNYWLVGGNTSGSTPFLAARGSDSTVGANIDLQGANTLTFSSHTFGSTEFQVFGIGGSSWLAVGSDSGNSPQLTANGAAGAVGMRLTPKGAGVINLNGATQVSGNLGFYSTAPIAQPTVTGSKGANAALTSLMTALASLGLVVNSTT